MVLWEVEDIHDECHRVTGRGSVAPKRWAVRPNSNLEGSVGAVGTGPPRWPIWCPSLAARFPRHYLNWTSQWSCDIQGLLPSFRNNEERLRDLLTVIQTLSRGARGFLVWSSMTCIRRVLLQTANPQALPQPCATRVGEGAGNLESTFQLILGAHRWKNHEIKFSFTGFPIAWTKGCVLFSKEEETVVAIK